MKVVSIIGARPQCVKAAAVSRVLRLQHQEVLVHTGQHYDYEMSDVFFEGLELPQPDVNLGAGSGSHAAQTAAMLVGLERCIQAERPDWVLIYGDTNSTLAAALAASKLCVPIAHVEAGLRSFDRRMPEEINRVLADHASDLLLCPSNQAVTNLEHEGISRNVHVVGDVMLDVLQWAERRADALAPTLLNRLRLSPRGYLLTTVHRAENTNNRDSLQRIIRALNALGEPIVFPVHPRTRKMLEALDLRLDPHVAVIDPLGYLEMIALVGHARLVLTDSGGLQKEAYWVGVPCVTLREQTEWTETVDAGWNLTVGTDEDRIVAAARAFQPPAAQIPLYGDGRAAERCVGLLENSLGSAAAAPFAFPALENTNAQLTF